jgi:ketosteroid isomerase-like protein
MDPCAGEILPGAMSQENVEIVRRCCDASARGDWEEAITMVDAEIEYDLTTFPEGRVYHGHPGIREAFRIWLGAFDDYTQEYSEIIDAGGADVVVIGKERGRGKGSGVPVEQDVFAVWTLKHGKAIRIRFFSDRAAALEDAGPDE